MTAQRLEKKVRQTRELRDRLANVEEMAVGQHRRFQKSEVRIMAECSTLMAQNKKLKENAKISRQILIQTVESKLSYESIIKMALADKNIASSVQALI